MCFELQGFCFLTRPGQSQYLESYTFKIEYFALLAISTLLFSQSDNIIIISEAITFVFRFRNARSKKLIKLEIVAKSALVTVRFQTGRSTQLRNNVTLLASMQ